MEKNAELKIERSNICSNSQNKKKLHLNLSFHFESNTEKNVLGIDEKPIFTFFRQFQISAQHHRVVDCVSTSACCEALLLHDRHIDSIHPVG